MALKLIILAGVLSAACVITPCGGSSAGDRIGRANAGGITAASAPSSRASDLRVVIEGVRSNSGAIMIGLYDSSEGFTAAIEHSTEIGLLNDRGRLVGVALRAAAGTQSIIFTQLPPRRYAVIVFHDENDNGRLDENAWGVPTEGYGFSNNARGLLGAPSFDAAQVTLDGHDRSIAISLIYPRAVAKSNLPDKPE